LEEAVSSARGIPLLPTSHGEPVGATNRVSPLTDGIETLSRQRLLDPFIYIIELDDEKIYRKALYLMVNHGFL
jgi:hypothetical protein